jgi:hypothetical protein
VRIRQSKSGIALQAMCLDSVSQLQKVADLLQTYDIQHYLQTTYHEFVDPDGCLQFLDLARSVACDIASLHAVFLFLSVQLLTNILELEFIVNNDSDRRQEVNNSAVALCRLSQYAQKHVVDDAYRGIE